MPNELNIEQQIREAMARGDFDDLKGKGKPLDLDAYFTTPEDVRMGFSILKANDFVPEEVERMNEIAQLRERLKTETEPAEIETLRQELGHKELALSLMFEKKRPRS